MLLEARKTLEHSLDREHPDWLRVNQVLVELYQAWGRPEMAEPYETK